MPMKFCVAGLCAAAIALGSVTVTPAEAQGQTQAQKKSAAKKVAAKKYGPVPTSMAPPPRARITVTRRSYLDAGTYVIPGDRKFTDYAVPPGYSPTSVIDNPRLLASLAAAGPVRSAGPRQSLAVELLPRLLIGLLSGASGRFPLRDPALIRAPRRSRTLAG